ncbi:MAG: hypothetical protein V3R94_05750, partial [Acidobacteriota bacterium]
MRSIQSLRPPILALALACLVSLVYSQIPLQVGYAVISADPGRDLPVGTALFSSSDAQGVLVWEAGVAAVKPISSGRIFVEQQGNGKTALALVNPSATPLSVTLVLRNESGNEVARTDPPREFGPGEHQALFVDQLFPNLGDFTGSLTFQTQQTAQQLAAVTLRQNTNLDGTAIFATLPVVDLTEPATTDSVIFPQVGAGVGLSTQLVLINASQEAVGGQIRLFGSSGVPLELALDGVVGSTFTYQIEGNGTFRGELTRSTGLGVGYAVVTLNQGSQTPAGSAIFQFTSGESVISEAGVLSVQPT